MKLQDRAVLVNLSISRWSGRVKDMSATYTVNTTYDAIKSGVYMKNLTNDESFSQIGKMANKIRKYHYDHTNVWSNAGDRLLSTKKAIKYTEEMARMKNEFNELVDNFLNNFERIKEIARRDLGKLYRESDYPSADDLRYSFGVNIKMFTLPVEPDNFLAHMVDESTDALRDEMQNSIQNMHDNAMNDLYKRVKDAVGRIIKTLTNTDKKFWKSSMVTDIKKLIEIIPDMNYMDDPRLNQIISELNILNVDPNNLKNDEAAQDTYLQRARQLKQKWF